MIGAPGGRASCYPKRASRPGSTPERRGGSPRARGRFRPQLFVAGRRNPVVAKALHQFAVPRFAIWGEKRINQAAQGRQTALEQDLDLRGGSRVVGPHADHPEKSDGLALVVAANVYLDAGRAPRPRAALFA